MTTAKRADSMTVTREMAASLLRRRMPRYFRILDWLAVAALLMIVLPWLLVAVVGPMGASDIEGIAERVVHPSVMFQGTAFDVQLRLNASGLPLCSATSSQSAGSAVALVIDHSGSMGDGPESPLDAARNAAQSFVDVLDPRHDQVVIVPFSSDARLLYGPGLDMDQAQAAVESIGGGGGTAVHRGVAQAREALMSPNMPLNLPKIIVMLTDGKSDRDAAINEADIAKARGIWMITVALGGADRALLQEMASSPEDFYDSPDPSSLRRIYQQIAYDIAHRVATNVQVRETYDDESFGLVSSAEDTSPELVYNIPVLTSSGRQFAYQLESKKWGWRALSPQPGALSYEDCSGQIVTQALPGGPRPLVLLPTLCCLLPFLLALAWLLFRLFYWLWLNLFHVPELEPRQPRELPPRRSLPPPVRWTGPDTPWEPEPALVIGLGGTGRWVLTHLKRNLDDASGGTGRPQVRLLALDTSAQEYVGNAEQEISFAQTRLGNDELLVVTEENLNHLIRELAQTNQNGQPELARWFPAPDYNQRLGPTQRDLARGTVGRRPMGRIALFRNLKDGEERSSLWQALSRSVGDVREAAARRNVKYQRLRVMIVGSLAGGFGSGTVLDLAYLARKACQAKGLEFSDAEVSLFLVGNAPFDAQRSDTGGSTLTRVNTRAALREVERFLLGRNRPFPIRYQVDTDWAVLDGQAQNILDDCWFFDGDRSKNSLAMRDVPPNLGLFPMLADALMLLLDTQAQSSGAALGALRSQVNGRVVSLQAELGQGVFSSLGSFTYRLPMRELVGQLKARFAHEMLALLLGGDAQVDLRHSFEPSANKEATKTPRNHAVAFVAGRSGSGESPLPLQLTHAIRSATPLKQLKEVLIDIGLRSDQEGAETYLQNEETDFHVYLGDACWRLLNGEPTTPLPVARSGKLAYTQAFLTELIALLEETRRNRDWTEKQGRLPRWTPQVIEILPAVLESYAAVARRLQGQLSDQEKALREQVYGVPSTVDSSTCVVGQLAGFAESAKDRLQVLNQIRVVRHYLLVGHDDEQFQERKALLGGWYRTYFAPHLNQALDYLAWEFEEKTATLRLVVRVNGEPGTELALENIPIFANALLSLAEHAGRQIWREDCATQLLAELLEPLADEPEHVRNVYDLGEPVLPYIAAGDGAHVTEQRFFWSPRGSAPMWTRVRDRLRLEIGRHAVTSLDLLDGTDAYSCTLIALRDQVPMSAIARINELSEFYCQYYSMVSARGVGSPDQGAINPEPTAVFPAEKHALEVYERRMLKLPERTAWILTSLFTGALEDLKAADLFLRAYAAGLVREVPTDDRFGRVCQLCLPDTQLVLTVPENADWQVALEVVGMQNFVLGSDDKRLDQQPDWADRIGLLHQELCRLGKDELQQRWEEFDARYLNQAQNLGPRGLDDLVACARISLRLQLGLV